jgi:hypothetical protein
MPGMLTLPGLVMISVFNSMQTTAQGWHCVLKHFSQIDDFQS